MLAALIALVPVALILGLLLINGAGRSGADGDPGPAYTLVQLNLCLSGRAGAFRACISSRSPAAVALVRESGAAR